MRWTSPLILLLLLVVPVLGWMAHLWLQRTAVRMRRLSRHAGAPPPLAKVQLGLLLGALALGVIALAGPRWGRSAEEVTVRGRSVMLAVDVSRSMLAEDVRPNRLGRAKADLIDLVDALQGDRAGLLAFRGKGVLLCPMTADVAFLRRSIESLAPDSAPPGETDLADAIAKCLTAFEQAESEHSAIVLISDGEDLAGRAEALAREAGERGVPIFTVGIGSARGATIPDGGKALMHDGKAVESRLTESTLRAIATASGGAYVPLATAGTAQTTLGAVYARYLTRLADREAQERLESAFTDRSGWFTLAAAVLALVAAGLSIGRVGGAPRRTVLGVLLLAAGVVGAQEPARDGQRAYRAGDFAEAAADYAAARVGAEPTDTARYAYNEALAHWKAGDVTNALEAVRLAVDARELTARAATLEGTLLLKQAETAATPQEVLALREEAVEAFARALRADPTEAARRNLTRALADLGGVRLAARRARALESYGQQPLGRRIAELLSTQRQLAKAVPEVFGGPDLSVRLAQAEQLGRDVRAQADGWFPVLEALPQAVTNETLRAELQSRTLAAQAALDAAAEAYETLECTTPAPLLEGEPFVYDLWKTVADPPALNGEAIAVQTNALTSVARYQPARDDTEEVLALTQQFRLLFPQWAEEQLQQAAASTNAPPFTAADRDEIARAADAIIPLLNPPVSPEAKREVMEKLLLIRDKLPKQANGNPQANPEAQPQNQPQNQEQSSPQESQGEPQEQPPQPSEGDSREEAQEQDLQALLQKAADRDREHEEAKRRALRALTPPTTRDW